MATLPERPALRRARQQGGFVLTLELLLLLSVLAVVGVAALIAVQGVVRNAAQERRRHVVTIVDDAGTTVGVAAGFADDDAPRVVLRDPESGAPVVLAVGARGFTSRQSVYYLGDGCSGPAFVAGPGNAAEPLSAMTEMQGQAFAVGAGQVLFRSRATAEPLTAAPRSVWESRAGAPAACSARALAATGGLYPADAVLELGRRFRPPFRVAPEAAPAHPSEGR